LAAKYLNQKKKCSATKIDHIVIRVDDKLEECMDFYRLFNFGTERYDLYK